MEHARTAPFGIYVHYPYCARRCPYCDFNVTVRPVPDALYEGAVRAEMKARAGWFGGGPARTVYFGGGTPGRWAPRSIGGVIEAAHEVFGLVDGAELTVECNPEDVLGMDLVGLRAAGVNRISLGTQSFDDRILHTLGRHHTAAVNRLAVKALRAAGFDNLSLDLIHGVVGQTLAGALEDVRAAAALEPEHISTYQLTVERKTNFGARARRGEALLVTDDTLADMFEGVRAALHAVGIVPYEISSAARPGFEAVHNRLYWTGAGYLGLGAGAHGFAPRGGGGVRWANERHAMRYIKAASSGAPAEQWRAEVSAEDFEVERVMTGLRLDEGLPVDASLEARWGDRARVLEGRGLLVVGNGRWRATARGRRLLDTVIASLVVS